MPDAPPPAPAVTPVPQDPGAGTETYKARGVVMRVFIYVVAGQAFAAFLWLLFYVGAHSHR